MGCDVSVSHFLCTLSIPILLHRADLRSIDEVTSFVGTLVSFFQYRHPCHKTKINISFTLHLCQATTKVAFPDFVNAPPELRFVVR